MPEHMSRSLLDNIIGIASNMRQFSDTALYDDEVEEHLQDVYAGLSEAQDMAEDIELSL
jgi:hypothetical protein